LAAKSFMLRKLGLACFGAALPLPHKLQNTDRTEHPVMRGFQRAGGSVTGYTRGTKLFELAKISDLRQTGERFAKARPGHNPNDSALSKVIISLPRPD
jgi:hypothetical protein